MIVSLFTPCTAYRLLCDLLHFTDWKRLWPKLREMICLNEESRLDGIRWERRSLLTGVYESFVETLSAKEALRCPAPSFLMTTEPFKTLVYQDYDVDLTPEVAEIPTRTQLVVTL